MHPQQNFRLFLTMEFNPRREHLLDHVAILHCSRIPANLIRLSRVYVFEPPSGVNDPSQHSEYARMWNACRILGALEGIETGEVRASLRRSFAQVLPPDRTDRQPVERCRRDVRLESFHSRRVKCCPRFRLHFLLAFLHAIVLERLRFFPVGMARSATAALLRHAKGWSKKYEFSDADQMCGRGLMTRSAQRWRESSASYRGRDIIDAWVVRSQALASG